MTDPAWYRAEVEALVHKYRVLVELRSSREEAQAAGLTSFDPEQGKARREAMRVLARRFPGSLRELDSFTAAQLEARQRRCEEELAREGPTDPFVTALAEYHLVLRHALWLKHFVCARGGVITPELEEETRAAYARRGPDGPKPWSDASLDTSALQRFARPPGGRIHRIVYEVLAQRLNKPADELERLLFGGD